MGGIVHILRQPSSDRIHARPTDSRASMDSRKASERGSERGHGSHWKENRKTSMFFHHFLLCFPCLVEVQCQVGGKCNSVISIPSVLSLFCFLPLLLLVCLKSGVFPRMAFQTPPHRMNTWRRDTKGETKGGHLVVACWVNI